MPSVSNDIKSVDKNHPCGLTSPLEITEGKLSSQNSTTRSLIHLWLEHYGIQKKAMLANHLIGIMAKMDAHAIQRY